MNLPEENPPRLLGETAQYEDDPFELGDIDDKQLVVVEDFLPRQNTSRRQPPSRDSSNPGIGEAT